MLPKRNSLLSAALLDIWSSNALPNLVKQRIGRAKSSPNLTWIMSKRCVSMHRPREIVWFDARLNVSQCWKKQPPGAKNGKGEPNAIVSGNNVSRKTALGKLRRLHGVKHVRSIKP